MKSQRFTRSFAVASMVLCTAVVGACCASQPVVTGGGGVTVAGDRSVIGAGISIGDARLLAAQYNLTGYKPLPPGIRKNLARGKPLPPGIAKHYLPQPFVGRLPRHPGHEWQRAGTDLVLVGSGSYVVQDVLNGVFD
jgi:hypothetical protein